ncbi:MAG: hypothetical protein DWH81_06105 [Planctomycetota bacterium]|nr:MAG: hypothetical protein DWH81_06105 [Planctomycetota bacterium]
MNRGIWLRDIESGRPGGSTCYTVNPPLVKALATWPLLLFGPKTDWSQRSDTPGSRPEFAIGRQFLQNNRDTWPWMMTLAR